MVKKASSPEQLNEYIKVTNPGVWVALLAVIVLLVGVCIWGIMGKLETTVDAVVVSDSGNTVCYVKENAKHTTTVAVGQQVKIGDEVYTVKAVSSEPQLVSDLSLSPRTLSLGEFTETDYVYEITLDRAVSTDGVYEATVVTETVSPLSFVFN